MKVTVAVVCLNEERNIASCLESLLGQSWKRGDYEILVVDNNSIDNTQKIIKEFQKKTDRIRLVINKRQGIASSRNVALQQAQGDFLAFTDADCLASKNWLKELIKGYRKYKTKNPAVIGVGGSNSPPKTTPFYQALGIMLNTFLGSRGSVQAKRYLQDRCVPHLSCANVLYEKKKVIEIGSFDESFGSIIEDEDLSFRLLKKGYQFVYLTQAGIIHKMADNFYIWARKMFIYGKGRMWFLLKHPERFHLYFLLPILLVLTLPLSLAIYLPAMFFYSLGVAFKKKRLNLLSRILGLYLATHLSYGLGEIYGFFKRRQTTSEVSADFTSEVKLIP